MKKIKIIVPWFGDWPPWMSYFLLSCSYNPQVNWMLLSDAGEPALLPPNIEFQSLNLDEFNGLASRKLKLKINIKHPYKICDFRPAFGYIFDDYLTEVDFWGYSDLDLIYGDIRKFLTIDVLENYDIISTRKDYLAGHFCIYRNSSHINALFMKSPVYQNVFEDSARHYAFDERSNHFGRSLDNSKTQVEKFINKVRIITSGIKTGQLSDMNEITRLVSETSQLRLFKKDMVRSDLWFMKNGTVDWEVGWNKGTLIDNINHEELLHFHFLKSKNQSRFKIGTASGKDFFIRSRGISEVN